MDQFYPLHAGIDVHCKNFNFGVTDKGNKLTRKISFLTEVRKLGKVLKDLNADVIISTDYVFTIAATLALPGKRSTIYSWEHHHFYQLKRSNFWQRLYKRYYPKVAAIICLNASEEKYYKALGCNTKLIPNFIETNRLQKEQSSKVLLSVGWLIPLKGFDLVPLIAEKVLKDNPGWTWNILGKGPEAANLEAVVRKRNLEEKVKIIEPVSHRMDEVYGNASVYVMTSRFECFPMVLLEAMSNGLPVVAFNCPTGPKHIISHESNGLLVPPGDVNAMADALNLLMKDETKRNRLASQATKDLDRFAPHRVYALWESLWKDMPLNAKRP